MSAERDAITVMLPRWLSRLMFGGGAAMALVPIGFALAGELPLIGAVIFAILLAPFVVAGIWGLRFKVSVRRGIVTVRPLLRRTWRFEVTEITRTVRHITPNSGMGTITRMAVYAGRRHVTVESLMTGSEAFMAYIEQNVNPSIIAVKIHGKGGRA